MPAAQLMTAREYMALPVEKGRRTNLVNGEVVVADPTWRHQAIQVAIVVAIANWIEMGERRGAVSSPVDVYADEQNVYSPDVVWYSECRVPTDPDIRPQALPDLAVEVRSPSTWRYDIGAKKAGYERGGLPELWLVDTFASAVLVFRRSDPGTPRFDVALELTTRDVLSSPLLEGFALPLDRLFAERD
ncbi:MAG TPA: Uma2 family endonuclease [Thermoleophilaceae bacterium]|nr:Uma2 family endonuclease [Thermoleophilaceae bacterium]